jgi:hypothetical protein
VTVRTVTEDNIREVGEADDDIEPIDGGVKPEKSGRLPSPFSRAENRYSKGRPITETQMQERVNDAYMLMLGGGAYRENACQLSTRYGVSYRQAEKYIHEAKQLMKLDFAGERLRVSDTLAVGLLSDNENRSQAVGTTKPQPEKTGARGSGRQGANPSPTFRDEVGGVHEVTLGLRGV